jgi:hypothetical protein
MRLAERPGERKERVIMAARFALGVLATTMVGCFPSLPLEKFPAPPPSSTIDESSVAKMKETFAKEYPQLKIERAQPTRADWSLVRHPSTGILLRRKAGLWMGARHPKFPNECFVVGNEFLQEHVDGAWAETFSVGTTIWLQGNLPERPNAHLLVKELENGIQGAVVPCAQLHASAK